MKIFALVVLIVVITVAIYTDIKGFRIKNILTFPTVFVALGISLFYFHKPMYVFLNFVILLIIGLLGEGLRLWRAGDTKLMVATGMWLPFISSGDNIISISFQYYLIFILLHLMIGHFYGLKKYHFRLKDYLTSILFNKQNEVYGKFTGAITIGVSVLILIGIEVIRLLI